MTCGSDPATDSLEYWVPACAGTTPREPTSCIIISRAPSTPSALRLEMPQVGRRLAFLRRHQEAVGAEEVALLADGDVVVVLRAQVLAPEWILVRRAAVALHHRPWPGERIVDDCDL